MTTLVAAPPVDPDAPTVPLRLPRFDPDVPDDIGKTPNPEISSLTFTAVIDGREQTIVIFGPDSVA